MLEVRFESFLCDQLLTWLPGTSTPGVRYQYRVRDSENGARLFEALQKRASGHVEINGTTLNYIEVGETRLIPVLHSENSATNGKGFNENYISMLRDEIANQGEPFEGCTLLVIHNSLLDTLLSTTKNLADPGCAWSATLIHKSMKALTQDRKRGQKVMECLLDWMKSAIQEEDGSMFGFEPLYKTVDKEEYLDLRKVDLFQDPDIEESTNRKQIEARLRENRELREEIETIVHHFPDELADKLSYFGDKFLTDHFQGENEGKWRDLDYTRIREEIDKQRDQLINFEGVESSTCNVYGSRPKSDTAAGRRERHLIVEASEDAFDLTFTFHSSDLDEGQIRLRHNSFLEDTKPIEIKRTKNRRRVTLTSPFDGSPTFFSLEVDRPRAAEQFKFRVLVLKKGEFHVPGFENMFLVVPKVTRAGDESYVTLQTDEYKLLINDSLNSVETLTENDQTIARNDVGVIDFENLYEESDVVRFRISSDTHSLCFNVEGEASQQSLSLPLLLDASRFHQLFNDSYNGRYIAAKSKVVLDNKEAQVVAIRQKLLEREELFVKNKVLFLGSGSAHSLRLKEIDQALYQSWMALLDYFERRETLPSLASWGPELVEKVRAFVDSFLDYVRAIPTSGPLTDEQCLVLSIGFAKFDGSEHFSPFHPLTLAYYLYLVDQIDADDSRSFADLPTVTRKRLNARGLIPFVFSPEHEFCYTQVVDQDSFWMEIVPQQDTSYSFVSKVVYEKILEFTKTFDELFEHVDDAPLLVNSVNNGDNREVFFGVLRYFQEFLTKSHHVQVKLYDTDLDETEFDRFAEMGAYDEIKQRYRLDTGKAKDNADTVIDLLRTRLQFSKFRHKDVSEQAYAHVTFFRNNEKIDAVPVQIEKHLSGMVCDGIINGETSQTAAGKFFTAFGLENVGKQDRPHLELASFVGKLLQPARKPNEPYHALSAIQLAVTEGFRQLLERSYDSSLWTTIIDPKVTLEFFRQAKDVVLIHYSDQYTSSAGYDAITVTRQTDLYKKLLGHQGDELIGEFNAFNGEWLLKMVTANDRIRLERRGIIGAWKLASALVSQSDICWIPLSVGEMVRISGNIGLKMDDTEFSRYVQGGRGEMSDDVLLAGFKDDVLYLLPAEVKTGSPPDFTKARKQVKALKQYLLDLLGEDTLESRLYRGLFVRQVLMQVEKYQLYEVFEDGHFSPLLDERERWLSGFYEVRGVKDYPEGFVIAHIRSETCFEVSSSEEEGVLQVEVPIGFLDTLVVEKHDDLVKRIVKDKFLGLKEECFLKTAKETQPPASTSTSTAEESEEKAACADTGSSGKADEDVSVAGEQADTGGDHLADEPVDSTGREPLRIRFGSDVCTGSDVNWEPTNTNKVLNPNTAIIGTMGTGKTQFTKSLITQLVRNHENNVGGKPVGVLIFDYKADYIKDDFVQATNATVYKLHKLPFNPFALFGDKPMLPAHTASLFRTTLATAYNLGKKQEYRIRSLVMDAYAQAGIIPGDKCTWTRPVPTMQDVWNLYNAAEKVEEDSLFAAMYELISFEIFESDTAKTRSLYDLVEGVTVIDLSGYDQRIQNLVVGIALDIFFSQMHALGSSATKGQYRQLTKFILVDEADNFMGQEFPCLKMVMKEGREFGVGTILSTQELTHFKTGGADYSAYILTWIVHRVANIKAADIKAIFNVRTKQDEERLMVQIRELEKHYSLYVDGEKRVSKIRDLAFWEFVKNALN